MASSAKLDAKSLDREVVDGFMGLKKPVLASSGAIARKLMPVTELLADPLALLGVTFEVDQARAAQVQADPGIPMIFQDGVEMGNIGPERGPPFVERCLPMVATPDATNRHEPPTKFLDVFYRLGKAWIRTTIHCKPFGEECAPASRQRGGSLPHKSSPFRLTDPMSRA